MYIRETELSLFGDYVVVLMLSYTVCY